LGYFGGYYEKGIGGQGSGNGKGKAKIKNYKDLTFVRFYAILWKATRRMD